MVLTIPTMLLELCFLYCTQITELLQSLLAAEILGCVILVEIICVEIIHFQNGRECHAAAQNLA